MHNYWNFDNGRLVARHPSGKEIASWEASHAMGIPLAEMFNANSELSKALLSLFLPNLQCGELGLSSRL